MVKHWARLTPTGRSARGVDTGVRKVSKSLTSRAISQKLGPGAARTAETSGWSVSGLVKTLPHRATKNDSAQVSFWWGKHDGRPRPGPRLERTRCSWVSGPLADGSSKNRLQMPAVKRRSDLSPLPRLSLSVTSSLICDFFAASNQSLTSFPFYLRGVRRANRRRCSDQGGPGLRT